MFYLLLQLLLWDQRSAVQGAAARCRRTGESLELVRMRRASSRKWVSWGMMYHRHRGVVSRSPPLSTPSRNLRLQFTPHATPPPPPCEIHVLTHCSGESIHPACIDPFWGCESLSTPRPPMWYWVHVPHLYSQKGLNAAGAMHVSSFLESLKDSSSLWSCWQLHVASLYIIHHKTFPQSEFIHGRSSCRGYQDFINMLLSEGKKATGQLQ